MSRLVVFDCDGTLVDSQANICLAMEDCFTRAHLEPPDRHAIRRVVGLSLVQAMAVLRPDDGATAHERLAGDYRNAFHRLRSDGLVDEPLYPGVADAVARLDAAGWLLGVATGKSDRGLRLCLDRHGLTHHFVTLQTADHHPSKPHPAMLQAAMAEAGVAADATWVIGDTAFDIGMAQAAGARSIGVDWGYHEPEELIAAGADRVISSAIELISVLEETS